jgi:hypothetical protein
MLFTAKEVATKEQSLEFVHSLVHDSKHVVLAKTTLLQAQLGKIQENSVIHLTSKGTVSLIALIEWAALQIAPCELYFCTWAVSKAPIEKLLQLRRGGYLTALHGLFSNRLETNHAEAYAQLKQNCNSFGEATTHAKVAVLYQPQTGQNIVINGSMNLSNNPRIESVTITSDKPTALFHIQWITAEIYQSQQRTTQPKNWQR